MLKMVGLWPPDEDLYSFNFYTLYAFSSSAIFQIGHIFFQSANLYFVMDDLQSVTGTIFILLTEFAVALKTYCLMKNMKTLKQLMVTINCDLFQPKSLEQRKLIQPNLTTWQVTVSAYWVCAFGCLFFWSLFPIFDKSVKNYRLPFLAWYPYNYKTSPQYEFTYLYQVLAICFIAMVNVNIDSLIGALNMYIAAQFGLLCDDLRNLHGGEEISLDINKKLKNCFLHHREILKFADSANEYYNWLLFVQ
ncbi:7tm 6 domain containing protein, partial [Asbolus verrucosus]